MKLPASDRPAVGTRIDARGLVCPMPLVRLQAGVERLRRGERLELIADDAGLEDDLPAWSEVTGHRLIALRRRSDGCWVALIERAGA